MLYCLSQVFLISLNLLIFKIEAKPEMIINNPETSSSIATKGTNIATLKHQLEAKMIQRPKSREGHLKQKGSLNMHYTKNVSVSFL